ncbi:putative WD repeat-containing protein [Wickerhamomyces ciferrii]|uniref:WD repeat-containing protein n=1 Tax=Wickerhamomyces ciferrii (strain ATCC 14091 / BCRC 22168 / CBS 111 / JCM 3599 / NBRC 0793 / NRRL Y-1031 F-60-10) TaxID=1206466 RepID=K0KLH8_WICCF|nr:putative WD repeat-containing protein [Wickerhamomyces ciferrii]CCH46115.1 putative WD repeat-containing protein [Wickerhamomyces ciferrii]
MTIDQVKRRKVNEVSKASKKGSKIFSPFRVIGNVSNDTPFAVGTLGSTFYIVTSVGRSFQIYDANTLHLLFVSQTQTSSKINALTAHFHYVYAAYENKIGIYKRGKLEHTLEVDQDEEIKKIIVFGEYLVATSSQNVFVFKKANGLKVATEFYTKIPISSINGEIIDLIHPPTYLNKIVVITTSNIIVLNIHSAKVLYTSEIFPDQLTTIESAPVLDFIAIGNVKGQVILFNVKKGKILHTIETGEAKVNSISFRTDGSPHLVAALNTGDLFFYDLDRNSRIHVLRNAHNESYGGVVKAQFLNGQPIVVTNGADNYLKEFVFDPSLSSSNSAIVSPPRHLRSRGGHSAAPSSVIYADPQSHYILSASRDRSFWSFSLRKDAQSQELSQRLHKNSDGKRIAGSVIREKFPEITNMAIENSREGEWENVLTCHKDENFARTWDSKNKRVGKHILNTIDGGIAKSVAISQCGNFGLVGSSNGGIGVYNLQSGIIRKKYQLHQKAVTGMAIDGMNRKMISVGLDGIVGFYDLSKSKYLGKLKLTSPITQLVYHRSSDLAALALDDLSIVIIDTVTQKIIRVFYGHNNRITSMDFSPDGRWIISAALDSTIRTWDLPTGGCIDGIIVPNVATSIKFSPLGDSLATTHVSQLGVCLWTNRSQFKPISTRHIDEDEFTNVYLPNSAGEGGSSVLDGALDDEKDDDEEHFTNHYETLDQIDENLITLSLGPRSKFDTLLNLDIIKNRNKPKEAPKKPENAPFFLQLTGEKVGDEASIREGQKSSILNKPEETNGEDGGLNPLKPGINTNFESEFTRLLREDSLIGDYDKFLKFLTNSSPAITDLEIKSLNTQPPLTEVSNFIQALTQGYKTNSNIELIEAWMNMLFKNHGDVLINIKDENVEQSLNEWYESHQNKTENFDDLVKYCSGVIGLLTSV